MKKKNSRKPKQMEFDLGGFDLSDSTQVKLPKNSEALSNAIRNGLSEAVLGFGFGPGTPLNQLETLWKNNRWYLLSNIRQLLSESYIEHGIIQTIVGVPVDDGFRGGVDIITNDLDPEEIEELQNWMDECNDLATIAQTCRWNRLFGGAGTVINVDQDPALPLDLKKITRFELYAADMWELFWNKQNTEEYSLAIDTSKNMDMIEYFNFYGHKLHKSKVLKQKGIEAPSIIRPRMRGWGVSVVEILVNSINQYLKANNLIFEVLDEFKIDYYKIKGLANTLLRPDGAEVVQKRLSIANKGKNYNNAVAMDTEDDWQQRQLTFAGIADTMTGIRMQIASDLRMPLSKVFGISSQGFSSGQDDIENYNAMVESEIRHKVKYEILKVVKIRCQLKYGFVPDDLKLNFKPLRILSAEQEENVKTQKFGRVLQARQAGEITSLEFRDACNKSQLLEIKLETDDSVMSEIESEKADKEEAAAPKAAPKSTKVAQEAKV